MTVTQVFILVLGLMTAGSLALLVLAYVGRQIGPPRCPRCLYDLTGAESERCSECGGEIRRGDRFPSRVVNGRRLALFGVLTALLVLVDVTFVIVWPHVWPERVPTRYLIRFDEALFPRAGDEQAAVREELLSRLKGSGWSRKEDLMLLRRQLDRMCEKGLIAAIRQEWPSDRSPRLLLVPTDSRLDDPLPTDCRWPYVLEVACEASGLLVRRSTFRIAQNPLLWWEPTHEVPWTAFSDQGELSITVRAYEQTTRNSRLAASNRGQLLYENRLLLFVRPVPPEAPMQPISSSELTDALQENLRVSLRMLDRTLRVQIPLLEQGVALALRLRIECEGKAIASARARADSEVDWPFDPYSKFREFGVRRGFFWRVELQGDMERLEELYFADAPLVVRVTGDADTALNDPSATQYWDGEFVVPLEYR